MNRFCTQCGGQIADADRFCTRCGAKVEAAVAPSVAPQAPAPAQRGFLAMGLALGGAALAAAVVLWVMRTPAPPPQLTPAAGMQASAPASLPIVQTPPAQLPANTLPAAPVPVAQAPAPAAKSAGSWSFSSNEDGVQLLLMATPPRDDDPAMLRLACNLEDGLVWANSRFLPSDKVDDPTPARHKIDLTLKAGAHQLAVEGYVTSAPEGNSIAWELPRSTDLAQLLFAPDLAFSGPGFAVRGADVANPQALAEFVRHCPPVAARPADEYGWGSYTNLNNGFRLDIPKGIYRVTFADRNGRMHLSDTVRGNLMISAGINAAMQPFATAVKDYAPKLDKVTYERRGKDFMVRLGLAETMIVYFKARATCDNANLATITITYDQSYRAMMDPVVERMAASFDATTLPDGRPLCP